MLEFDLAPAGFGLKAPNPRFFAGLNDNAPLNDELSVSVGIGGTELVSPPVPAAAAEMLDTRTSINSGTAEIGREFSP